MAKRLVFVGLAFALVLFFSRNVFLSKDTPGPQDLEFSIPNGPPVTMHLSATSHYQVNSSDSDAEYEKLLPTGGHTVHVGERVFTVALFHQMKCLDILRREYVAQPIHPSPLARHCLLYLRQAILCQSNPRIESVRNSRGSGNRVYDAVCQDWTLLYDEAERNQREYLESQTASLPSY